MGHLHVVTRLSDQLYRKAWSVFRGVLGSGAVRDLITVGHYKLLMVVHLKTRGHGTHCYNEISIHPPLPQDSPKNVPRIPV